MTKYAVCYTILDIVSADNEDEAMEKAYEKAEENGFYNYINDCEVSYFEDENYEK